MNDAKDKPPEKPDAATGEEPSAANDKRSGRVGFDSRGNSVWEWQLETGVYSRDVSTHKLKKLNLGDLSIAESAIQPGPLSLADDPQSPQGGNFNPYNNAPSKQTGFNPYDNARKVDNKLAPKGEPPKKRLTLDELRKLSEVIKAQRNKDKDKG